MAIKKVLVNSKKQYTIDTSITDQSVSDQSVSGKIINIKIDDKEIVASIEYTNSDIIVFKLNNKLYKAKVKTSTLVSSENKKYIILLNSSLENKVFEIETLLKAKPSSIKIENKVLIAPIAGKVIKNNVSINQYVKKNDTLFIIESMKMENVIKSNVDAFIKTLSITEGDLVEQNQELISFDFDKEKESNEERSI